MPDFLGPLLIIGTICSYMPQYYKLYQTKSPIGINHIMLIMGNFSSFLNMITSIHHFKENNNSITPTLQMIVCWLCLYTNYCIYIYYSNIYYTNKRRRPLLHRKYTHLDQSDDFGLDQHFINVNDVEQAAIIEYKPKYSAYTSFILTHLGMICVGILSAILYSSHVNETNQIFNIIAAILSIFMWYPQLRTTYIIKHERSLSLIALFIHSMGCILTIVYQYYLEKQDATLVLSYIVAFLFEFSILCLCIWYKLK